jgi:hypothetical protein
MKHINLSLKALVLAVLVLGSVFGNIPMTFAQNTNVSISGRVVDAVTGNPLPGDTDPFTFVQLLRCPDLRCFEVNAQPADTEGRFQFNLDFFGQLLQVVAFANQYQQGETDLFEVAEGEDRDVGDIPLQPLPVQFFDIVPCENLPSEGGRCQYSVRVTNHLATRLDGEAWSMVQAFGIGSFTDFTNFQLKHLQQLRLKSQESREVRFEFRVPSKVRDGAFICTNVFVGERPDAFFDTVGATDLFCISKGTTGGFSVVSNKKAQQIFRQLNGRTLTPPKKKK